MNLSDKISHIDIIPNVPLDRAGFIAQNYCDCGAEVQTSFQPDGRIRIEATFREDSVYLASKQKINFKK